MTGVETLERRIVTVLFADLVGFTTLSEQYDPEDIAQIQDRYFAVVRETIGRYGGRLEKFIGDAAMAVFGVPRSRDDDAQRAVRAGLALTHAVQQLGAELGLDDDVLRLRVGVNTGEAVIAAAGAYEGRVTGDTVNTAARLQTAAPPGTVLIGPTTALAVADAADLDAPIALDLKGKAEPLPAQIVRGFRPEPSRDQAMGELRAPTIGREVELGRLIGALDDARRGSSVRVVVIAPPGVGKSRLLREFADRAQALGEGAVVWRSRARSNAPSVLEPIAELVRDALAGADLAGGGLRAILERSGVDQARAAVVERAVESLISPRAVATDERAPTEEREALFASWLDALDVLAGDAAQLWLVEDVHWAGGDVLAFLEQAGERASSHGRLVVATARPSLLESSSAWAEVDPGRLLQLATLQATDAQTLVRALVGDALPSELIARIAERSDGNCLFIEELLRTWVSVGTLARDETGSGWRLAVAADEVTLPQSVQSIYAAQLDDLPPDARRLARRASVAGRRFPVRALEPLDADGGGLEPLQRRALLAGPVAEPLLGDAFTYRHALLRDAGYASLARAERARLHIRLATWLEQAAGERVGDVAEQIATHYSAALTSASALATEVGDGLDREQVRQLAADWYERAGQSTLALAAHEAARSLLKQSIELTPAASTLDGARRWERLGDATAFAADMDEGAAAYQRSIDLYRRAMSAGAAAFDSGSAALDQTAGMMEEGGAALERQLSSLGDALGIPGLGTSMSDLADSAAELRQESQQIQRAKGDFEREMATAGLARATAALGDVWYQQLRFADSRRLVDATLAELPDLTNDDRARLLVSRGVAALGAEGPTPTAHEDLERALQLAERGTDDGVKLAALSSMARFKSESGERDPETWRKVAELAQRQGRWSIAIRALLDPTLDELDDNAPAAFPQIARVRELAHARGLLEDAAWTEYWESEAAFVSGDWDRAVAAGRRALDVAEANAYRRVAVRTIHVMVPIAAVRGDRQMLERAAAFYRSLEGKFEFPDSPYARIIRTAQDLELAAAGLADAYVPEVEPRLSAFADEPGGGSWTAAIERVFRAWLEAGDLEGAERALAVTTDALPTMPAVSSLGRGHYDLLAARLAEARGDVTAAADWAHAALARFRASDAPWWMAKAIRVLVRVGAADEELLREVQDIERRLGAFGPTA